MLFTGRKTFFKIGCSLDIEDYRQLYENTIQLGYAKIEVIIPNPVFLIQPHAAPEFSKKHKDFNLRQTPLNQFEEANFLANL